MIVSGAAAIAKVCALPVIAAYSVPAVALAVNAHNLDQKFHAYPATVPKFVDAIPKFNQKWLDDAKRNAALRRGETPSAPSVAVTPAQLADRAAERQRIVSQTECAAEKRFGEPRDCGKQDICRGCPQAETPGKGRYSPGPSRATGLTPGGAWAKPGEGEL